MFKQFIQTRVGEPVTAIDLNKNMCVFGQICGFIGYFVFSKKDHAYLDGVYEEIIRDIYLDSQNIAYVSIGDLFCEKIDFDDLLHISTKKIMYDMRTHLLTSCPGTIVFLDNTQAAILTVTPTQNKDINFKYKNGSQTSIINFITKESKDFGQIKIPQNCVPFDYKNFQFLWVEFLENQNKLLQLYSLKESKVMFEYSFDCNTEFVSFCKIYGQYIIMVIDQQLVKVIDTTSGDIKLLYSHDSPIQCMNIYYESQEIQNEQDQIKEISMDNIQIASVDYDCTLKLYKENKISKTIKILKIDGVPDLLIYHKYIFDMDYPYFLKFNDQYIVFSCDFGLIVIQI